MNNPTETENESAYSSAPKEPIPFYQPIVALESGKIVGYEALGRQLVDGSAVSLGPFFSDGGIPTHEHVRIDRLLREQAIAKLSRVTVPTTIFINLKPSWIYRHYHRTGELHTVNLLKKYGIPPGKVCIEITEDEFNGSLSELHEVIDLYRASGCRIAIDDIGTGFSNFDRIAQIQPNLLKIDIHLMNKSAYHSGYLGVMRSFSTLAEQIGASLLVEGVESRQDLKRAIQIGARYVQGYLFSPAEPDFRAADSFTSLIKSELDEQREHLQATLAYWQALGHDLTAAVRASGIRDAFRTMREQKQNDGIADDDRSAERADTVIRQLLPHLDARCIRVFLCRDSGIQVSANHYRDAADGWKTDLSYRHADWSWRPYFIPHLTRENRSHHDARVSTTYADLDTHAWIRTISIPIDEYGILFMDVIDQQD